MDKVDESKVAEALEFLRGEREKAARNKLDEAFAIGEYLWREFFKNDPTSATHKGEGSTSYSALIARPELAALGLSKTTLWNYVTVAVEQREFFEAHIQKERLPPSVRTLGFTQRVRLASCKKVSDTLRIATVAAEQGLSPNAVAQLVKDANAGKSPRKPAERLDEDTKLIIQAAHLVRVASTVDVTSLPDDELHVLASMVTAQLGDQAEALEGRLAAEAAARTRPSTPAPIEDEIDFDEVFTELTGSPPPALPQATPDEMRARLANRARKLLADLESAQGDVAVAALVEFVAQACTALDDHDAKDHVLEVLGVTRTKAAKWFVVVEQDAEVRPESLDRNRVFVCRVFVPEADEAVSNFEAAVKPIRDPVVPAGRVLRAFPLTAFLADTPTKPTLKAYLSWPKEDRLPTLHEYVKAIRVAGP